MSKKKDDGSIWIWLLVFLGLGIGAAATASAADPIGGGGGGGGGGDPPDPDPGLGLGDIPSVPGLKKPGAGIDPSKPGGGVGKPDVDEPFFPGVDPPEKPGVDPGGPTPAQIDDWIKVYPTPATFYQVKSGDNFTGSQGVATRLARTALFQAAHEIGGLAVDEANAWASSRSGYATARSPVTQWIACTPWNDALYATYAYGSSSIAGQQGRAIRMLNTSAPNADRIRGGEPPIRNVRLCAPGDKPSCSASPINGAFRKFELLWLPGFDLQALWESSGLTWQPGGTWDDGSSKIQPPPKIWLLGIQDLSDAGVGAWGCAPYSKAVP